MCIRDRYMRTLQPGAQEFEGVLFRFIFINLLPDVVREVVANIDDLDEMAEMATTVYQANANASAVVNSVSDGAAINAIRRPPQPRSSGPSAANRRRGLCRRHSRFGRDAHRCDRPESCPMRDFTRPPQSGNGPAGRV